MVWERYFWWFSYWHGSTETALILQMDHDDVIKWKHFLRYWPFVWGIHRSPVNSLHKGKWRIALMFSLICTWINGGVNNHKASDLRHDGTHYDVTVIMWMGPWWRYAKIPHSFIQPWGRLRVRIRSIEKTFKLEVLSCCTKFHEPHVVLEYAHF